MDYTFVYETMFFQLVICSIYSSVNTVEPYSTLVHIISQEATVVKEHQNMLFRSFFFDEYMLSLDDPCKMYLCLSKALVLFSWVFYLVLLSHHDMIFLSILPLYKI